MWNEIAAGRELERGVERLLVERTTGVVDDERAVGAVT